MSKQSDQLTIMETLLEAQIPVFLWGEPGIGKTSAVQGWAKERGYRMLTLIGSLLDPTDLSGMPTITDAGRTRFAPPEWMAKIIDDAGRGRWVIFLDELNCSSPAVMAAMLRLISERAVHEHKLPRSAMIVAAGNDPDQVEIASPLPASMASRFAHLEWAPYWGSKKREAEANGWPVPGFDMPSTEKLDVSTEFWRAVSAQFQDRHSNLVFDFARNKGRVASHGRAYPTGRTWTFAEQALGLLDAASTNNRLRMKVAASLIGQSAAAEFMNYAENLDLPDPESWISDPASVNSEDLREDQIHVSMTSVVSCLKQDLSTERWRNGMRIVVGLAEAGKRSAVYPAMRTLIGPEMRPRVNVSEQLVTSDIEEGLQKHFLKTMQTVEHLKSTGPKQ